MTVEEIRARLFELQDEGYREFQSKLIPTVDKECVIGIRLPDIKKLAKEIVKSGDYGEFLADLPHRYYDENQLHASIISLIKGFDECVAEIDRFLPYVDSWAVCDTLSPKAAFGKNREKLPDYADGLIASGQTYAIRFGIRIYMDYFLSEHFRAEYAAKVAEIRSEEYYVNMMRAWYFATALAKNYDEALPFIEDSSLDQWTHNKSIQKARESYRVSPEHKEYLNTLKRTD